MRRKRYEATLMPDDWNEMYMFKTGCSLEEARKAYHRELKKKGIALFVEVGVCEVCYELTCFVSSETGHYVCSEECRREDIENSKKRR